MAKFTKANAKEFGSRGGRKTLRKHGKKHFSKMGKAYKKSGDKSGLQEQADSI